ncbi:hypothetical protein I7I50_03180 [Histoplasma capsulatum G186AR]|uniref:Uncharacterized protein n=1 Tax=Ajellomyces capsulatus TaxID=5037 RepID=A0A8H7Z4I0_AJECA|nr:hypothetical protein I7I52_00151 [Histoplasma capsulatum]QSS72114.1 hypothetical protein I7I50_03180 [Histoplasma capsulatum G186AR]
MDPWMHQHIRKPRTAYTQQIYELTMNNDNESSSRGVVTCCSLLLFIFHGALALIVTAPLRGNSRHEVNDGAEYSLRIAISYIYHTYDQ